MLRIELLMLDDDADPFEVSQLIKAGFPEDSMRVEIRGFAHHVPHKQAWRLVAEVCDTCGDLVNMREDPLFNEHNNTNYERHVEINCSNPDYPNVPRLL
jgi:hypothetical protein